MQTQADFNKILARMFVVKIAAKNIQRSSTAKQKFKIFGYQIFVE